MEFLSEIALDPQTQTILIPLLILVAMLRKTPAIPNWSIQWIILILAISFSILQSGFIMTSIYQGFIISMMVTYITRGVVGYSEEKKLCQLQSDCNKYKQLFDAFFNSRIDK